MRQVLLLELECVHRYKDIIRILIRQPHCSHAEIQAIGVHAATVGDLLLQSPGQEDGL